MKCSSTSIERTGLTGGIISLPHNSENNYINRGINKTRNQLERGMIFLPKDELVRFIGGNIGSDLNA